MSGRWFDLRAWVSDQWDEFMAPLICKVRGHRPSEDRLDYCTRCIRLLS